MLHARLPLGLAAAALLVTLTACGGGTASPVSVDVPSPSPKASDVSPRIGLNSGRLSDLKRAAKVPPTFVSIDSIGVSARIRAVGVDAEDQFDVPSAQDVGWYRYGPTPGAAGSALLAAHVAYNDVRGAFSRLEKLKPGARIDVDAADGSTRAFVVVRVRSVQKSELSDLGVFDRTGPPVLNLVTCGGQFDAVRRSYSNNVVVTAEPAV